MEDELGWKDLLGGPLENVLEALRYLWRGVDYVKIGRSNLNFKIWICKIIDSSVAWRRMKYRNNEYWYLNVGGTVCHGAQKRLINWIWKLIKNLATSKDTNWKKSYRSSNRLISFTLWHECVDTRPWNSREEFLLVSFGRNIQAIKIHRDQRKILRIAEQLSTYCCRYESSAQVHQEILKDISMCLRPKKS